MTDVAMASATRKKVLAMVAADRIAVAGSHLPFPGVGHVDAKGDAEMCLVRPALLQPNVELGARLRGE